MMKPADLARPETPRETAEMPAEEALAQLRAQLQLLEEHARAQVVARPLRELLRLGSTDAQRIGRGGLQGMVLIGAAAVAGLTAYVCAVAAAVLWLARQTDPVLAAGVVALVFAGLTAAALALAVAVFRRERRWLTRRAAIYREASGILMRTALGPRLTALLVAIGEPEPPETMHKAQGTAGAPKDASRR